MLNTKTMLPILGMGALSILLINAPAFAQQPFSAAVSKDNALRANPETRNPVLKNVRRFYVELSHGNEKGSTQDHYEKAVSKALNLLHESPDAQGGGAGIPPVFQPGGGNKPGDGYDSCRKAAREMGATIIEWDGVTLDWTGTRPMIEGTVQPDVIIGTSLADLLIGYGGGDIICGGPGDDLIYGDQYAFDSNSFDDGADRLNGGPGNDVMYGGGLKDVLIGFTGHDTLLGGSGFDSLYGDDASFGAGFGGDDFLVGMWGSSYYVGEGGNDVVNDAAYSAGLNPPLLWMGLNADQDTCWVREQYLYTTENSHCEIVNVTDW